MERLVGDDAGDGLGEAGVGGAGSGTWVGRRQAGFVGIAVRDFGLGRHGGGFFGFGRAGSGLFGAVDGRVGFGGVLTGAKEEVHELVPFWISGSEIGKPRPL